MSPNAKKLLNALNPKKLIKPLRPHRDRDEGSDTVSNGTAEDDSPSVTAGLSELGADDLTPRTPSMRSEISQGGMSSAEELSGVLFEEGGETEGEFGGVLSKDVLEPLKGGVLVDELYGVTAKELNRIIFGPGEMQWILSAYSESNAKNCIQLSRISAYIRLNRRMCYLA